MLKCAAEYLAIRDEVMAIKEAEARKKEGEKLATAIANSIDYCENQISKWIEEEVEKGKKEIRFYFEMSRPSSSEESPLKESYIYEIAFTNYSDGRRTGKKPYLCKEKPYHYPTIKKYLADHCINIEMKMDKYDYHYNAEGPNVYYACFVVTVPNNPPCV